MSASDLRGPASPARVVDPALAAHFARLAACSLCPQMQKPVVTGRPVRSRVILVGQAPGVKEPVLGRPFAWTAGKTLFGWFRRWVGWTEDETRDRIYFAAVCRCFPGKKNGGGDRVPDSGEINNCRKWLDAEIRILDPELIIPVGRLAIGQFLGPAFLTEQVGKSFSTQFGGRAFEVIPLPHPSGASPWHRMEPGRTLLASAMERIAAHPAILRLMR